MRWAPGCSIPRLRDEEVALQQPPTFQRPYAPGLEGLAHIRLTLRQRRRVSLVLVQVRSVGLTAPHAPAPHSLSRRIDASKPLGLAPQLPKSGQHEPLGGNEADPRESSARRCRSRHSPHHFSVFGRRTDDLQTDLRQPALRLRSSRRHYRPRSSRGGLLRRERSFHSPCCPLVQPRVCGDLAPAAFAIASALCCASQPPTGVAAPENDSLVSSARGEFTATFSLSPGVRMLPVLSINRSRCLPNFSHVQRLYRAPAAETARARVAQPMLDSARAGRRPPPPP